MITAVDPILNPTIISNEVSDVEIFTVQLEIEGFKVRIFNGYGPQDTDTISNRLTFWAALRLK